MTNKSGGFIYVVGVDWNGPVKIGVAIDVSKRLERLQSGNHLTLALLWHSPRLIDPFAVESALHQKYADQRVRGEWFKSDGLSAEVLSAAVESIIVEDRNPRRPPDQESAAAIAACNLLFERLRRQGMNTEDAIGHLAAKTGMGRSAIWSLRYRPPTQIMITPYAGIVAELWRELSKPDFGPATIPDSRTVMDAISEAEAALSSAESKTGTEG